MMQHPQSGHLWKSSRNHRHVEQSGRSSGRPNHLRLPDGSQSVSRFGHTFHNCSSVRFLACIGVSPLTRAPAHTANTGLLASNAGSSVGVNLPIAGVAEATAAFALLAFSCSVTTAALLTHGNLHKNPCLLHGVLTPAEIQCQLNRWIPLPRNAASLQPLGVLLGEAGTALFAQRLGAWVINQTGLYSGLPQEITVAPLEFKTPVLSPFGHRSLLGCWRLSLGCRAQPFGFRHTRRPWEGLGKDSAGPLVKYVGNSH